MEKAEKNFWRQIFEPTCSAHAKGDRHDHRPLMFLSKLSPPLSLSLPLVSDQSPERPKQSWNWLSAPRLFDP